MGRATSALKRISHVLRTINGGDRTVYKRTVRSSGGDPLTGQGITFSTTDTLVIPQPIYGRLGRNIVGRAQPAAELDIGTKNMVANDYETIFSGDSVALSDLQDPNTQFVFKDSQGNAEVFRVTDWEPMAMGGTVISWVAYLRSTERPDA